VKSNIAFRLVRYGDTYEELQIEDEDNLLVENSKQQELDIDDIQWFWLIWNMIVQMKQRLPEFNIWASWASFLGQLAQLYD
jgi:hypothetical protein